MIRYEKQMQRPIIKNEDFFFFFGADTLYEIKLSSMKE